MLPNLRTKSALSFARDQLVSSHLASSSLTQAALIASRHLDGASALHHYWLGAAVREVRPYVSKIRMPFNARRMKKEWERSVELDPDQVDARYGLMQFHTLVARSTAVGGDLGLLRTTAAMSLLADEARRHALTLSRDLPLHRDGAGDGDR